MYITWPGAEKIVRPTGERKHCPSCGQNAALVPSPVGDVFALHTNLRMMRSCPASSTRPCSTDQERRPR